MATSTRTNRSSSPTDYFNCLAFDSPLDIKFRSDALGKTVLFIGYSMSDMNIRLLLHNLWRTWQQSGYEKDRPKQFAFMSHANPMQDAILGQWGIVALNGEGDGPEQALTAFLSGLKAGVDSLRGERTAEQQRAGISDTNRAQREPALDIGG
jgi:hypothetical protein